MSCLIDLLCLASVPRMSSLCIRSLVTALGSPGAVLRSSPERLVSAGGIEQALALAIARHRGGVYARDQIRRAARCGARIITAWDSWYPDALKTIADAPILLYVLGTLPEVGRLALAVVGTRTPSPYGMWASEYLARELARRGITVVSGLARGIDTIAHRSSLASGGTTVAVLGSGLDVPYPRENASLMSAIARSGAVVSEFPMGTTPCPQNFPRRNRIISGLSFGCIVVESDLRGGAMITASCAHRQKRALFAVPGSIAERTSAGPHALIRDGRAKLVGSIEDVLTELRNRPGGRAVMTPQAVEPGDSARGTQT